MLQGTCLLEALQSFLSLALDEAELDDSEDGPSESKGEGNAVEAGNNVDKEGVGKGASSMALITI